MHASGSSHSTCRFCEAPNPSEVIRQTSGGLRALASYGGFVPGWTIIVPPQHLPSTARLGIDARRRFDHFRAEVGSLIERRVGRYVMFEHGAADFSRPAGCGVDHAHLHLVPLDMNLREAISSLGDPDLNLDWQPVVGWPEPRQGNDYIWVSDRTGSWVSYTREQPSQVARRAIARVLGIPQWDWKLDLRLENVRETTRLLSLDGLSVSA